MTLTRKLGVVISAVGPSAPRLVSKMATQVGIRRRILTVVLPACVAATVPAFGVVYAQQTGKVSATEFQFAPSTLTVTVGQPVTWTVSNDGTLPHDLRVQVGSQTVDAAPGDANIAPGSTATFNYTFTAPGTYEFWCPVGSHRDRGMVGTLTVVAAGAGAPRALPNAGDLPLMPGALGAAAAGIASLLAGLTLRRRRG
jgi:plastocyanin